MFNIIRKKIRDLEVRAIRYELEYLFNNSLKVNKRIIELGKIRNTYQISVKSDISNHIVYKDSFNYDYKGLDIKIKLFTHDNHYIGTVLTIFIPSKKGKKIEVK